jgi:hypothetical protein
VTALEKCMAVDARLRSDWMAMIGQCQDCAAFGDCFEEAYKEAKRKAAEEKTKAEEAERQRENAEIAFASYHRRA